jgi:sugar porter (SP) family MFS transporter
VELQVASVLYILGTLGQFLSPNLALLLLGRIIYGLGIGFAMHVAPLYIAETSPNDMRGQLVSLKEAVIVGGIILGYAAGAVFGGSGPESWRSVYECAFPIEALMAFAAFFVAPESPRWLALQNRSEEAITSLLKCQPLEFGDAERQVKEMRENVEREGDASDDIQATLTEIFSSPYNRQALTIGVGLVLFQQLSGQPSVLYFANRIFEDAGLGFEAAVGVGLFKLVATVASSSLVENPNYGRKKLLLYGNAGITLSLAALTALYATAGGATPDTSAIIACILAFVASYQVSYGPITWLILSEVFPLRVRSAAVSIGTLTNFGSNLLVALLFEIERKSLGEAALFGQFGLIALAGIFFTLTQVFETQGLSLEEIELRLRKQVDDRNT